MISLEGAVQRVLDGVVATAAATHPLAEATGLVLAEAVVADVDMPPFDKAAVDGYAVKACDAVAGASFDVLETVMAGATPTAAVAPGQAVRVMTGAPVPASAETVIMLETTRAAGERIEVLRDTPAGRNVCRRGEDMLAGTPLLPAGTIIQPQHVGLLAGQGAVELVCHRRPTIAVLATGDEIVPPEASPGAGQIRNANNAMLVALARQAAGHAVDLGIAADTAAALRTHIVRGLESDVLLCSGGVSAGALDLVPQVLAACGVCEVFHHVAMQPGRPVFYGRTDTGHVFGLPGNPVAAFVCFKTLVEPLLRTLRGLGTPIPPAHAATFEGSMKRTDDRARYVGVELLDTEAGPVARRIATHGPADLAALSRATGLAILPPQTGPYQGGESVQVIPL